MLRKLEIQDAEPMLKWMKDEAVGGMLMRNFKDMTIEDCVSFIEKSYENNDCLHFAVCDKNNQYQGTISLKNIEQINKNAEYAIAMSKISHGSGLAMSATEELLQMAFTKLGLYKVYLCVLSSNKRAISFYHKCGFVYEGVFRKHSLNIKGYLEDLEWYSVLREEFEDGNNRCGN